ncbi:MAG: hypothetical protein HYX74_04755 [Acidobacteria bacterium]|nr:hypothetical protein [Acidobacteriota bacterium]
MKSYRIHVAGRIFENSDPRVLIKHAVAAKRSATRAMGCGNCGTRIAESELLAHFGYCTDCIERAVAILRAHPRIAV